MKILNPLQKVFVSWLAATGLAGIFLEPVLADTVKPAWAIVPGGTILDDGVDPPAAGGVILPAGLTSAGVYFHVLDKTGLATGATLNMVHVGVAVDGVVYASNLLSSAPPDSFKIWRWENDSNPNPGP